MVDVRFVIMPFRAKFERAMVDLWRQCGLVVPWNDPVMDVQRKKAFQPGLFFVGLSCGKVVGSVMAGYDGHRGWLYYVAVLPKFQGLGFGRRLVAYAVRELQKLGCVKVNLQVRRSNLEAVDFYKHLGFKEDDVVSLGLRLEEDKSSQ